MLGGKVNEDRSAHPTSGHSHPQLSREPAEAWKHHGSLPKPRGYCLSQGAASSPLLGHSKCPPLSVGLRVALSCSLFNSSFSHGSPRALSPASLQNPPIPVSRYPDSNLGVMPLAPCAGAFCVFLPLKPHSSPGGGHRLWVVEPLAWSDLSEIHTAALAPRPEPSTHGQLSGVTAGSKTETLICLGQTGSKTTLGLSLVST